jgi:Cdc6-like AAA superfamily ATPase
MASETATRKKQSVISNNPARRDRGENVTKEREDVAATQPKEEKIFLRLGAPNFPQMSARRLRKLLNKCEIMSLEPYTWQQQCSRRERPFRGSFQRCQP